MVALIQRPAPSFKAAAVVDGLFEDVSLTDYLGQWVVLFFYPMDFTFVCPTEIWPSMMLWPNSRPLIRRSLVCSSRSLCNCSSQSRHSGVSTDSQHSHFAWANQPRKEGGLGPDLKLPLIADRNMSISRDYGVLLEDEGIALRGLFIIDPKGILRQITVNDLPVGRSVDETIRLIKAFQFTYGEVCPANWHEGDKTMKADPKGSKEYFSAVGDDAPNKRARQA
ncbi:thioredoxin-like protein [Armillaria novae-zelandiae]|uniref:Thioredoxin-like protein n=1 Tax=Armillaria novae-zelandiae TaxID=153914 RepID=A0AA39NU50_9AGAR|nr:thioredoxin-like protein [Armillaria novae-zelandiae]